jgi:hypothetical protein
MGFEGQAQLVQEWFTLDAMSETSDRWVYVKHVLMTGDVAARSLTLGEIMLSNPEFPEYESGHNPKCPTKITHLGKAIFKNSSIKSSRPAMSRD